MSVQAWPVPLAARRVGAMRRWRLMRVNERTSQVSCCPCWPGVRRAGLQGRALRGAGPRRRVAVPP